jgi:hypothetical protein
MYCGPTGSKSAASYPCAALLLNLPRLALPLGTIIRMAREHPFTEPAPAT